MPSIQAVGRFNDDIMTKIYDDDDKADHEGDIVQTSLVHKLDDDKMMMTSVPSSMQSFFWLRVKVLLQTMEHRRPRRTTLMFVQIILLLAASVICYQKYFFDTQQPESSGRLDVGTLGLRPPKHWTMEVEKGGNMKCRISTTPVVSPSSSSIPLPKTEQQYATFDNNKEQYAVHIHGLHHTGTGYMRQTLYDALNDAFSNKNDSYNATVVASMQDSLRPYQKLLDEVKDKKKLQKLQKRLYKPEDEGQHLQSIYPSFAVRHEKMKKSKGSNKNTQLAYIADLCDTINGDEHTSGSDSTLESDTTQQLDDDDINKLLGKALFQQWSRYWDTSATFLLQKSPTLDVLFLEKTKIMPTLHVMVVRHPMTSNSWGTSSMGYLWLKSWAHVFQALNEQKIEWYAVVSYEALISHHDQVVEELLEVVRSGMERYEKSHSGRRRMITSAKAVPNDVLGSAKWSKLSTYDNDENGTSNRSRSTSTTIHRRRLELHENKDTKQSSTNPYLIPKSKSIQLWKKCLGQKECKQGLSRLTKDIFPCLGYASYDGGTLRSKPGTVTVRKEYGRVLFTSEGMALNKLRQASHDDDALNRGTDQIEYVPTIEFISKMKKAL